VKAQDEYTRALIFKMAKEFAPIPRNIVEGMDLLTVWTMDRFVSQTGWGIVGINYKRGVHNRTRSSHVFGRDE